MFSYLMLIKYTSSLVNIESYLFTETHSEHIIRKTQLMIAKGELSLGDVAINYIDLVDEKSSVKELRVAEKT